MITSIPYYLKKGKIYLGLPETLKSLMVFSVTPYFIFVNFDYVFSSI